MGRCFSPEGSESPARAGGESGYLRVNCVFLTFIHSFPADLPCTQQAGEPASHLAHVAFHLPVPGTCHMALSCPGVGPSGSPYSIGWACGEASNPSAHPIISMQEQGRAKDPEVSDSSA